MSTQITVTLPEDVLQRAKWWAERAGRPVANLLAGPIEISLRPCGRATVIALQLNNVIAVMVRAREWPGRRLASTARRY